MVIIMRNDICQLITAIPEGTEIVFREREIFCEKKSVVRSEFFSAYAVGLTPQIMISIDPDDFSNCSEVHEGKKYHPTKVRFDGEVYVIIRTYQKNIGELEITAG